MVAQVRRRSTLLVVVVALVLLPSCGTARISDDQATKVAVDAFAAAGLHGEVRKVVKDATVDRAGDGAFIQVHQVTLEVDGVSYDVGVSRTAGAVVRLTESRPKLTDAQARAIAAYRDNPAESTARTRRALILVVALAASAIVAAVLVRRARLAAERAEDTAMSDEIPLD